MANAKAKANTKSNVALAIERSPGAAAHKQTPKTGAAPSGNTNYLDALSACEVFYQPKRV